MCALELVVGKDGREHIIELNDSATSFMGDTQEEDRRHLSDLVLQRMQVTCLLRSICSHFFVQFYTCIKMLVLKDLLYQYKNNSPNIASPTKVAKKFAYYPIFL